MVLGSWEWGVGCGVWGVGCGVWGVGSAIPLPGEEQRIWRTGKNPVYLIRLETAIVYLAFVNQD